MDDKAAASIIESFDAHKLTEWAITCDVFAAMARWRRRPWTRPPWQSGRRKSVRVDRESVRVARDYARYLEKRAHTEEEGYF
jgi:hypothetical protein